MGKVQKGQLPAKAKSFFEHLPYDIRAIIYSYLEPKDLPPFTPGFQGPTSGFILSCRLAKEELEAVATVRLSKYLEDFNASVEKSSGFKFHFSDLAENSTMAQLRQVTIMIPYTSWPMQEVRKKEKPDFWKNWLPLFENFFDKIQFKTYGSEDQWPHESMLDRGLVEVNMHRLLSGLLFQVMPMETMNTKRICFSWDLNGDNLCNRPGLNPNVLNGKSHRHPVSKKESMSFYRLRDEVRLAGETGVEGATLWEFEREADLIKLFNGASTRVEYCSSNGQGQGVRQGLVGISETEFEAREDEIERLIYDC